jgi:hypothetical protein
MTQRVGLLALVLCGCATLPPTDQVIRAGLDVLQCVEPAIVKLQQVREAEAVKAVGDAVQSAPPPPEPDADAGVR